MSTPSQQFRKLRTPSAAPSSSSASGARSTPSAAPRMLSASGGHRTIAAAWKGKESDVPSRGPTSPISSNSHHKKRDEEESKTFSPERASSSAAMATATAAAASALYSPSLQQQRSLGSDPSSPTGGTDPFAPVAARSRGRPRSAASTARSSSGDDDAHSRPPSAPAGGRTSSAWPLPPALSHLYFPSQSFPPFLLSIASRVFHAKMRDLAIKDVPGGNVDKERRFVWLVCRQSMGASGAGSNSTAALSAPSSPVRGGGGGVGADGTSNELGLMALRIPDASLGPQALREVCQFLARDTRFAHLQLSGNILGDDGALRLADLLRTNTNLTSLDIRATGLGQHAFATLLAAMAHHPSLTALEASSVKSEGRMFMGVTGCKALAKVLKHNSVLRKLHLANAGLVSEGVGTVVRGLALNRTLVSLDLSSNDLTPKSIGRLGEALGFLHTLQTLVLAENRMGTVGVAVLCETLRKMENLKRLDLRKNAIGSRGFTILTDAVGEMISLQELLLDGNAFTENSRTGMLSSSSIGVGGGGGGMFSLGASSSGSGSGEEYRSTDYVDSVLKRLHLAEKRVSARLCHNTALRTLSLNHAGVSDRLVEDLARILQGHRGLQSLHLAGNSLGDPAAFALAELIRHAAPSFANLHASENSIGDDGGAALCLALAAAQSNVTYLSLRVNNVGKASAAAVLHALGLKRSLHVDLSGNKIPWVLYSKVNEVSAKNRRVFCASLAQRYQVEYERLLSRHDYRLQVEDQCLDAVSEMVDLTSTLSRVDASHVGWKEAEADDTKRLQQELHDWNHHLHEVHAIESKAEAEATALTREMDGRVMALRKAIEKEQRFIASAEKLIPQTLEEIAKEQAEMEHGLVDVRRDLRLYTTDRNVEFDGLVTLKADLLKFIRDLEAQTKPSKAGAASSPKRGGRPASSSPKRGGRPISSKTTTGGGGKLTSPASSPKKSPSSKKTLAKTPSSTATATTTRPPSASATGTRPSTRPPSAGPGKASLSATPSRPDSAAARRSTGGNGAIAAALVAAATAAVGEATSPSARKRASTAPMAKGKKSKGKVTIAAMPTVATTTEVDSLAAALTASGFDSPDHNQA